MAKNLIKEMKERIAKSGSSKKEILYFGADTQHRIRFLQELDEGVSIQFHNDFNAGIYSICSDPEDHEDCELCKEGINMIEQYAWCVWDYDSNSTKIFLFKASGVSPIPSLIEMYEEFGTMMDRDYKIKKVGKGQGSSYVVTPLDKSRFRAKCDVYSAKEILEKIKEAYPAEKNSDNEDIDDDKEEKVSKKIKKNKKTLKARYEELDMDSLKDICLELGMSKKEFKEFDDEEEVVDDLFDEYEEEDLEEVLNEYEEENDDED